MKTDAPNKLIIFIWNKQVSRKKRMYKKNQKLCDQFHEDTNIASIQLPLSYTSKKADHDPVYMKNLLGHTKRQQDKHFKLLHIMFWFHIGGSMILLFCFDFLFVVFFREWGLLPRPVTAPELVLLWEEKPAAQCPCHPKDHLCKLHRQQPALQTNNSQKPALLFVAGNFSFTRCFLTSCCLSQAECFRLNLLVSPGELREGLIIACARTECIHVSVLLLIIH